MPRTIISLVNSQNSGDSAVTLKLMRRLCKEKKVTIGATFFLTAQLECKFNIRLSIRVGFCNQIDEEIFVRFFDDPSLMFGLYATKDDILLDGVEFRSAEYVECTTAGGTFLCYYFIHEF